MKLWLDDMRSAPTGFCSAKTVGQAIKILEANDCEFASLDYDVHWDPGVTSDDWENRRTGMGVILWMEENNKWPAKGVAIHSSNAEGAKRMRAKLGEHYVQRES